MCTCRLLFETMVMPWWNLNGPRRLQDTRSLSSRQQTSISHATSTLNEYQKLCLFLVIGFVSLMYFSSQLDLTQYYNTSSSLSDVKSSRTDTSGSFSEDIKKSRDKQSKTQASLLVSNVTKPTPSKVNARPKLRFDYTNLKPNIDLTQRMVAHQSNCSLPMGTFIYRNRFGLGSDLHVWGQALCNGMALDLRIRTVGNWTWMDQQHCSSSPSPMLCYFQHAELDCPGDVDLATQNFVYDSTQHDTTYQSQMEMLDAIAPKVPQALPSGHCAWRGPNTCLLESLHSSKKRHNDN